MSKRKVLRNLWITLVCKKYRYHRNTENKNKALKNKVPIKFRKKSENIIKGGTKKIIKFIELSRNRYLEKRERHEKVEKFLKQVIQGLYYIYSI